MRKTINAREVLADINAGMTKTQLMDKYRISSNQVIQLYKKLKEKGLISQKTKPRKPLVINEGSQRPSVKGAEAKEQPESPVRLDFRKYLNIRQARMTRTLIAFGGFLGLPIFANAVSPRHFYVGQLMPLVIWCLVVAAVVFFYRFAMKNLMEKGQIVAFKPLNTIMRPKLVEVSRKPGYLAKLLTLFPGVAVQYEFEFEGAKRKAFQLIYLDEEIKTDGWGQGFLVVNPGQPAWHRCVICEPATALADTLPESSEVNAFPAKGKLLSGRSPLYFVVLVVSAFLGPKLVLGEPRSYVASIAVGFAFAFGAAVILTGIKYVLKKHGN